MADTNAASSKQTLADRVKDYKHRAWSLNDQQRQLTRELRSAAGPELKQRVDSVLPDGYVVLNVRVEPYSIPDEPSPIGFEASIIVFRRNGQEVPDDVLARIREKADVGLLLGKYGLECARFLPYDPSS